MRPDADPDTIARRLTAGPLLARNTIWNLVGAGAPLLVALVSIPLLIQGMGTDRFGLLTLSWVVIGYFSFFDLGLGWALTKLVSDRIGSGRAEEIPPVAWTALGVAVLTGITQLARAELGLSPALAIKIILVGAAASIALAHQALARDASPAVRGALEGTSLLVGLGILAAAVAV